MPPEPTAVITADGSLVRHVDAAYTFRGADGAWADDRHVALIDDHEDHYVLLDVDNGARGPWRSASDIPILATLCPTAPGRIWESPAETRLVVLDADSPDPRLVITSRPSIHLDTVDVALPLLRLGGRRPAQRRRQPVSVASHEPGPHTLVRSVPGA